MENRKYFPCLRTPFAYTRVYNERNTLLLKGDERKFLKSIFFWFNCTFVQLGLFTNYAYNEHRPNVPTPLWTPCTDGSHLFPYVLYENSLYHCGTFEPLRMHETLWNVHWYSLELWKSNFLENIHLDNQHFNYLEDQSFSDDIYIYIYIYIFLKNRQVYTEPLYIYIFIRQKAEETSVVLLLRLGV